ncbi:glycosyltransferase family 39 protein [Devosia sp. CN2-171]|uniref:glycosyltransferase family 39 protein n=1 Tax=Devosia sp. CN2-171 TaxID=3400909 RepID=UPI003BF90F23
MQELIDRTARDNYPPLHNIFLFAVTHTFGDSEFWLRLPSVVFGTLTIPAVYWVGCKPHSRRAGLFAAAILSLAAFHVDYSQGRQWRYWEDRGYEWYAGI